jgi:hypothetical protein
VFNITKRLAIRGSEQREFTGSFPLRGWRKRIRIYRKAGQLDVARRPNQTD